MEHRIPRGGMYSPYIGGIVCEGLNMYEKKGTLTILDMRM